MISGGLVFEDLRSPYLGSDPFPFPILEPVHDAHLPPSTPPLDLSQFPATIDTIFLSDHSPNLEFSYHSPPVSPLSPCLVFPHPHPQPPYNPHPTSPHSPYSSYSPPSPHSIANTTMTELTQLSPDLSWDSLHDSPLTSHHDSHMTSHHDNSSQTYHNQSPHNHCLTHHPMQDILSSALVLNDITYDVENTFENVPNDNFLLQPYYKDLYQEGRDDFSRRYDYDQPQPPFSVSYMGQDTAYHPKEMQGTNNYYGLDKSDTYSLIASECAELVPSLVDHPTPHEVEWCENTSQHRAKLADNLLLMSTLPEKPPEKMQKNLRLGPNTRCFNCGTNKTSLWRRARDAAGSPICNACGLYEKLHDTCRPLEMRKDSVQPRKRKQPSQGRKRRNKNQNKGKDQNESKAVSETAIPPLPTLQPVPSKPTTNIKATGLFNTQNFNPKTFPFNTLRLPPPMKKDFKKENEEKVFITDAEAEKGIAPLEISRGMRSYSCMSEECKNLHFSSLEGPNSVKEHIARHHREKI
eukprot:GFUD01122818.1.p1 GENE.GFUD01122818.1~~GFUD01122818.1.p1  ORF type:complete len:521 (+),score=109.89 GFUD01122818.1:62-1624(+)